MSNSKENSSLSPSLNESPGAVPISDTVNGLRAGCFKVKDNTFYFQHDNTASNDDKIIDLRSELGYEGYGIYWALLELLHQNGGKMQMNSKRLAFALQVDEQKLSMVINEYDLFTHQDGIFYSKRLLSQIEYRAAIVDKRRDAGSKGGKSKANAKQMLSNELPKERKGKERKIRLNNGIDRNDEYLLNDLGWSNDTETFRGIKRLYPKLLMMKVPLSFENYTKLEKKWGFQKVKDIFSEMQNYSKLFNNNDEAVKTADNWIRRNEERNKK